MYDFQMGSDYSGLRKFAVEITYPGAIEDFCENFICDDSASYQTPLEIFLCECPSFGAQCKVLYNLFYFIKEAFIF